MSLVGPRPALPHETEAWDPLLTQRLRVKPGITGMWQVNGRSETSFEDYTRLDLYYVDNWSLLTDLAILAKTSRWCSLRKGALTWRDSGVAPRGRSASTTTRAWSARLSAIGPVVGGHHDVLQPQAPRGRRCRCRARPRTRGPAPSGVALPATMYGSSCSSTPMP